MRRDELNANQGLRHRNRRMERTKQRRRESPEELEEWEQFLMEEFGPDRRLQWTSEVLAERERLEAEARAKRQRQEAQARANETARLQEDAQTERSEAFATFKATVRNNEMVDELDEEGGGKDDFATLERWFKQGKTAKDVKGPGERARLGATYARALKEWTKETRNKFVLHNGQYVSRAWAERAGRSQQRRSGRR